MKHEMIKAIKYSCKNGRSTMKRTVMCELKEIKDNPMTNSDFINSIIDRKKVFIEK